MGNDGHHMHFHKIPSDVMDKTIFRDVSERTLRNALKALTKSMGDAAKRNASIYLALASATYLGLHCGIALFECPAHGAECVVVIDLPTGQIQLPVTTYNHDVQEWDIEVIANRILNFVRE